MKKEKITQDERVLRHLKKYGSITSWEAFKEYGITRLSARIFNLKNYYDIEIEDEQVKRKNRYGEFVYFKKYKLKKK